MRTALASMPKRPNATTSARGRRACRSRYACDGPLTDVDSTPYASAWRGYRLRRWLVFTLAWGFPIAVLLVWAVNRTLFAETVPLVPVLIVWVVLIILAAYWYAAWRCPRCGKAYSKRDDGYADPWTRYCLHCSLPRWASRDPNIDSSDAV